MIKAVRKPIRESTAQLIALAALLLLSVALRVYRLDAQSFWYDEGNSARIAERSAQLIIEGAAGDIHPPLYYLLLSAWRGVAGESEAALRSLSVLCGVLLVLFTYLLGRDMVNPRVGLIAAALAAISPFVIYYSQEARMYIMLAFLAAASTWALVRLEIGDWKLDISDRRRAATGLLYVVATAAGLYTQYAYPFVMVAQGACVVLALLMRRDVRARRLLGYAALNVIAILIFLPWLPIAISQVTSWTVAPATYQLDQAMLEAYRWLVVGRTLPLSQAALPLLLVGVLAVIGLLPDPWRKADARAWLMRLALLILTLLPFVLLFVFKLYREAYLKFLLVCATPLLILAAAGIVRAADAIAGWLRMINRRTSADRLPAPPVRFRLVSFIIGALLILGVASSLWPALDNLYHNPAYARDDYRGIARMIEADAQDGDAVLLNAPNQWEVFTYYHRRGAPSIPLLYRPQSESAVNEQLSSIAVQYQRLFVLYYAERESDPSALYERWLARNAYKADEQWVGNIRLAVYGTRAPSMTQAYQASFGTVITLTSAVVSAQQVQVGDVLTLRLTLHADQSIGRRYKIFIHLGTPDAAPVAQNDAEPVAGFRPTTTWIAIEPITDLRGVWIKPGTPVGVYGLYVGLYDSANGQRLLLADGTDRLRLGDVEVVGK